MGHPNTTIPSSLIQKEFHSPISVYFVLLILDHQVLVPLIFALDTLTSPLIEPLGILPDSLLILLPISLAQSKVSIPGCWSTHNCLVFTAESIRDYIHLSWMIIYIAVVVFNQFYPSLLSRVQLLL